MCVVSWTTSPKPEKLEWDSSFQRYLQRYLPFSPAHLICPATDATNAGSVLPTSPPSGCSFRAEHAAEAPPSLASSSFKPVSCLLKADELRFACCRQRLKRSLLDTFASRVNSGTSAGCWRLRPLVQQLQVVAMATWLSLNVHALV